MKIWFFVILLIFIPTIALSDGFIIIPRPPQERAFIPLSVKYHHVEASIDNQVATTKVDQVFLNENNYDLEGVYIFPIPEGASISDFAMYVDGKRVSAEILEKKKAREIYDDIVRRMRDPALLEYIDRGAFRMSIYPITARGEKRVQLEYSEVLKYDSGICKYAYPLNTEKFSAKPINSVSVSVNIKSKKAIKSVYSPSHEVDIRRSGDYTAKIGYEASDVKPDKDMIIYYTVSDEDFGLNLLAHRPDGSEDGFFMLLVSPKVEVKEENVIEKDIIFVIDKSGSMQGEKLDQAKAALKFCIKSLNDNDRFGIISFSTDVDEMDRALLTASKDNIAIADKFIDKLKAIGGTNINDALITAIDKKSDPKRPKIIVFLTDGLPTIGERDVESILKNVDKARSKSERIFAFGVGYDVNTHFLDKLAETNGGTPQYVEPSEDIEIAVSNFYNKISEPVLSDLSLDIGSVKVKDVYPKSLPDLFKGSQLLVLGRYDGSGGAMVKLNGVIRDKKHVYENEADFPQRQSDNDFIPRLWAQRKIGYLLDEIRSHGEDNELKDEIIRLSKKYGVITPYTSFLVLPEKEAENLPLATRQLEMREALDRATAGVRMDKGQQAVAASKALKGMKSAPMAKEMHKPGDGSKGEIKYVGSKTFFLKNGFWTDSQYEPEMKVKNLKYGSDEYFDLISREPDIARYLALGKKVIVCHKGECYKIEE